MKETQHSLVHLVSEEFVPNFSPGGLVIRGESAGAWGAGPDAVDFLGFGLAEKSHAILPEVLVYSRDKNRLFLIDSVFGRGPINEKRREELAKLFSDSSCQPIFITAVSSRTELANCADEIAWGTVVWAVDTPDHLIHFGGHGLLGPATK